MLAQKVRIKFTRAKRGVFEAVIPARLLDEPCDLLLTAPGKRQLMVALMIQLRLMQPIIIEVRKKPRVKTADTFIKTPVIKS